MLFTVAKDEIKEETMQAIDFETMIDHYGRIYLPKKSQYAYGKFARLVVLFPEQEGKTVSKGRQPGSAKGILRILSEDDEHLDDFKEYMP